MCRLNLLVGGGNFGMEAMASVFGALSSRLHDVNRSDQTHRWVEREHAKGKNEGGGGKKIHTSVMSLKTLLVGIGFGGAMGSVLGALRSRLHEVNRSDQTHRWVEREHVKGKNEDGGGGKKGVTSLHSVDLYTS
jgi:hypothetical protein